MNVKRCNKCLCELSLDNFSIQLHAKDNYSPWCKKCHSEYTKNNSKYDCEKQKEYYNNNIEKFKMFCQCGYFIFKKDMKNHLKRKIHIKRMSIISDFNNFMREQNPDIKISDFVDYYKYLNENNSRNFKK